MREEEKEEELRRRKEKREEEEEDEEGYFCFVSADCVFFLAITLCSNDSNETQWTETMSSLYCLWQVYECLLQEEENTTHKQNPPKIIVNFCKMVKKIKLVEELWWNFMDAINT